MYASQNVSCVHKILREKQERNFVQFSVSRACTKEILEQTKGLLVFFSAAKSMIVNIPCNAICLSFVSFFMNITI